MLHVLTREISPAISQCALTHLARQPIDVAAAILQHRCYEECLAKLGCRLYRVPAAPELPDSVFIEDTCVVLDEIAIITRPALESRQLETRGVAKVMSRYRPLSFIQPPATLDGGDVLKIGRHLFVGLSSRSNIHAVDQLSDLLTPLDYRVTAIPVEHCLHLKSAVTQVCPNAVLLNPEWLDAGVFHDMDVIVIDPSEPFAANALMVGETVLYPQAFRKTQDLLAQKGIATISVDVSELAKAEGGVTCCSLIFDVA